MIYATLFLATYLPILWYIFVRHIFWCLLFFVVISSGRRLEQLVGGGQQKIVRSFLEYISMDEMKIPDVGKHLLGLTHPVQNQVHT